MDCVQFERALVELIDTAAQDPAASKQRLRQLQEHAMACGSCAGCADLLQWLGRPAAARGSVEDPGAAYWEGFEVRTRERIRRDAATGVAAPVRRWIPAAAAAAVLLLLGTWAVLRDSPRQAPGPVAGVVDPGLPETPGDDPAPELPDELARLVGDAPGDELLFVDELAGWGPSSEAAELFPDVSDLDVEAREAFLKWLREKAS